MEVDYPQKLLMTSDSGYILVSASHPMGGLMKTDRFGNIIWFKHLFLIPFECIETINSELFIVGNGPIQLPKQKQFITPQIGIIQTDSLGNALDCIYHTSIGSDNDKVISTTANFSLSPEGVENIVHPDINTKVLKSFSGCVEATGSIKETSLESDIIIYPNPSDVIFNFVNNRKNISKLTIFNLLGESVYRCEINDQQTEVDLSSHPRGIYFFNVIFSDKTMKSGKLILTR